MTLARWACGHEVVAIDTENRGDNGLPECPFCKIECLQAEIKRLIEVLTERDRLARHWKGEKAKADLQINRLQAENAKLREILDLVEDMIKGQIDYRVGCSPSDILRKIKAAQENG